VYCVLIFSSGMRYTEVLLKRRTEKWPELDLVRGSQVWSGSVAKVDCRCVAGVRVCGCVICTSIN
jgi:hypothetical protein